MLHRKPLKILCVHQGYELYGSDRVFIQSVRALRQKWPQSMITVQLPQHGPIVSLLEPYADNIILGHLSVLRKNSFRPKHLYQLCRNVVVNYKSLRRNDLIYINTGVIISYIIANIISRRKIILHIHEIPTGLGRLYFYIISQLTHATIISNSQATAMIIGSQNNVIHNGIGDIDRFDKEIHDDLNLLLIGRINDWKGHLQAIEALYHLKQKNIKLRFAGSYFNDQKPYQTDLIEKIKSLGLEAQIIFSDFDPDPAWFYKWADIVLVPSIKPEPFGLVAIEAMRSSLPVIATNHGGLPEIVMHNETGILVKPACTNNLTQAVKNYYYDRELMTRHGQAGRERFLRYFQEKDYISNFTAVVEKHVA